MRQVNSETRHHIKQLGVYLANNIPHTDSKIRQEMLIRLAEVAEELGINFKEFCQLINSGYEVKEPIRN